MHASSDRVGDIASIPRMAETSGTYRVDPTEPTDWTTISAWGASRLRTRSANSSVVIASGDPTLRTAPDGAPSAMDHIHAAMSAACRYDRTALPSP
jgi:hypothetical protein